MGVQMSARVVLKGFLGEVRALSGEEFLSCPTKAV